MKTSQVKLLVGFVLNLFLLNACAGNQTADNNSFASNTNQTSNYNAGVTAKDDIEDLEKIVKLPFTPEEVTYNETDLNDENSQPRIPAPNEKKLVAVLKFSKEQANQLAAQAEKYKPSAPSSVDAENWFPPELIAKSQESGDSSLKGIEYAANDFFQPPYANGHLTRVNDTDYFILELTSF